MLKKNKNKTRKNNNKKTDFLVFIRISIDSHPKVIPLYCVVKGCYSTMGVPALGKTTVMGTLHVPIKTTGSRQVQYLESAGKKSK